MKKAIVAIAGLSCLLASADDASAYVKKAKTSKSSTPSVASVSAPSVSGQYFGLKLIDAPKTIRLVEGYGDEDDTDLENYLGIAASYGLQLGNFRVEVEAKITSSANYKKNDSIESVDYELYQQHLLLNAYYDMSITDKLSAFVTAGIGLGRIAEELEYVDNVYYYAFEDSVHQIGFVYQLGLGLDYKMSDTITLDVGYRYASAPWLDDDMTWGQDLSVSSHELFVGGRYYF